jgi:RNA polymerase sigma factor (sigma-70 family)
MSQVIAWIAAVAESEEEPSLEALPSDESQQPETFEDPLDRNPELRTYRRRTVSLLRKYMRYSLETGRMPSLVGREIFGSRVTQYRMTTFEDRVIFVHDMEKCLERLDDLSKQVLAKIVLQEYEHEEAARLMGCTRMTIHRWLVEALDKLSEILLASHLLKVDARTVENCCQEGLQGDFCTSDGEQRK